MPLRLRRFAVSDVPESRDLRAVYRALRERDGVADPDELSGLVPDRDPRVLVGMLEQAGLVRRGYDRGRRLNVELPAAPEDAAERVERLLDRARLVAEARAERMVAFAESDRCRHGQVAEHFGETAEATCGACDVCAPRDVPSPPSSGAPAPLPADIGGAIVRAVGGLVWPLGRRSLVATLRGSLKAPPSARRSPSYGLLEAASEGEVTRWVQALERCGALVEVVTPDGYKVLRADPDASRPTLGAAAEGPADEGLVERLRRWRLERSRTDGVPAYVVLHDAHAAGAGRVAARVAQRSSPRSKGSARPRSSATATIYLPCSAPASSPAKQAAFPRSARRIRPLRLRRRSQARPRPRRIRKLRLVALLTVLFLLAAVAFSFGLVRAVATEIPSLDPANQQAGRQLDTVIYAAPDANGQRRVLTILRGDESRVLVGWEDIAPVMRQSIVSIEDRRFYQHDGVDLRGIARALWQDIQSQQVIEGGSTITQQFVKNAYIRNERSIGRKVREAALAWQLEQKWSKERILTAYLNTIYFGNGAYGIQQAARTYFDKGAKRLTLAQAALLAGIPADPSRYDPVQHPRAAKARRDYVLQRMFEDGKISAAARAKAEQARLPDPVDVRLPGTRGPAPYFASYVTTQLVEEFGAGRAFGGGLEVRTTIDLKLQELARKAIEKILDEDAGPAAALVAVEPSTGAVKAMFGGDNFRRSQFNLATQAERQPGSSFKPIVLATALREGLAPVTRFDSKPVTIDAGDRLWRVTNYDDLYLGSVNLADALVRSDNAVYAQLTKLVRPKNVVDTAHRLGIGSDLPAYFSIGLGAVAVNPLDMARAYATIANDGYRVDGAVMGNRPRVVESVVNRRTGKERTNERVLRQALAPGEARTLTSILERVVRIGTGTRAAIPGRATAGKTGTTDNYGDAWFVGYTPQLVVAVWVGYPNELKPMLTEFEGRPVTGGTLPALIWKEYMSAALRQQKAAPEPFADAPYLPAVETRVVFRDGAYRRDNGYCPGTRLLAYVSGREPPTTADCKQSEVTVPSVVGSSLDTAASRLQAVPLTPKILYAPAPARQRPGTVVRQYPARGFLSAGDEVTIYVTKAKYGLVPNLVGSSVEEASDRLRRLKLRTKVTWAPGPEGTVLEQSLQPGVAAAPGLTIKLVVARERARATP